MRTLTYREAISEALCQCMDADPSIFITGIGVDYSAGIFGTTTEALKRFGPSRVFEAPAMENALTGICIGAAAMGKRPVLVHARNDFSFLGADQLINLAAKWNYMYGGNAGTVPLVVRMIVGKGWGQGATHAQSLHAMYSQFPGLQVAVPATPSAAYTAISEALELRGPSVIIEHRALYETKGLVPDDPDDIGEDDVQNLRCHPDSRIAIVAVSHAVNEALSAADILENHGVRVTVSSPLWIDQSSIRSLVLGTSGKLLVVDTGHETAGMAGEIIAKIAESNFGWFKAAPRRLTLPACPTPVSKTLEDAFYPRASTIVAAVLDMLGMEAPPDLALEDRPDSFKGPY